MIPPGAKLRTVGELTAEIRATLEDGFRTVWVVGEVSNLSRPQSGHLYFNLKDADAVIRGVIWRGVAMRLRFDLKDGMEVVGRGRVAVYPPQGAYQIQFEELQPKGVGALELAFQQLKEKLFTRGYFDPRRKKPIPPFPRRVALVTSPTGAAIRDMLEILKARMPAVDVLVVPVKVQGEGSAASIADAIRTVNAHVLGVDVIVVGRGGGSLEDLWTFNEVAVADAIFASRIPVVSAVGHETDVTIADLVADRRALTPSEAATSVVPDRRELMTAAHDLDQRMHAGVTRRLDRSRDRLAELSQRRAFRAPLERVHDLERRLDELGERLDGSKGRFVRELNRRLDDLAAWVQRAAAVRLQRAHDRLAAGAARLEAVSPLAVLGRGYSLTQTEGGAVVRDAAALKPGDRVRTRLLRGEVVCRVESIREGGRDA